MARTLDRSVDARLPAPRTSTFPPLCGKELPHRRGGVAHQVGQDMKPSLALGLLRVAFCCGIIVERPLKPCSELSRSLTCCPLELCRRLWLELSFFVFPLLALVQPDCYFYISV